MVRNLTLNFKNICFISTHFSLRRINEIVVSPFVVSINVSKSCFNPVFAKTFSIVFSNIVVDALRVPLCVRLESRPDGPKWLLMYFDLNGKLIE